MIPGIFNAGTIVLAVIYMWCRSKFAEQGQKLNLVGEWFNGTVLFPMLWLMLAAVWPSLLPLAEGQATLMLAGGAAICAVLEIGPIRIKREEF